MTTRNEHTGDLIQSKPSSKAYRDNMQRIIDAKKRREAGEAYYKDWADDGSCPHCGRRECAPWCGTTEPRDNTPDWAAE